MPHMKSTFAVVCTCDRDVYRVPGQYEHCRAEVRRGVAGPKPSLTRRAMFSCRRAVDGRRVGRREVRPQRRDHRTLSATWAGGATATSCRPTSRSRSSTPTAARRGSKSLAPRTTATAARTATVFRHRCRCPRTPTSRGRRSDLRPSGNTEGQGDCHLLVAERDDAEALRDLSGQQGRRRHRRTRASSCGT